MSFHHSFGDEACSHVLEPPGLLCCGLRLAAFLSLQYLPDPHWYCLFPNSQLLYSVLLSAKSFTLGLNSTINLKQATPKDNHHNLIKIGKENSSALPSFTILSLLLYVLFPWFKIQQNNIFFIDLDPQ